jgi:hypothetical protein
VGQRGAGRSPPGCSQRVRGRRHQVGAPGHRRTVVPLRRPYGYAEGGTGAGTHLVSWPDLAEAARPRGESGAGGWALAARFATLAVVPVAHPLRVTDQTGIVGQDARHAGQGARVVGPPIRRLIPPVSAATASSSRSPWSSAR